MSVLRRAYVEVEPDITGFDTSLREKFARADPGGKAGKQLGGQLNRALKRLDIDPVDIRGNPKEALAAIALTEARLRALSNNASTVEIKVRAEQGLREVSRFRKQLGEVGGDAGPEAAAGFAAKFSQRLGPLIGTLPIQGPLGAAMGAAGLVAAPVFISAFASGLSAGAGFAVIGLGLKAAAADPLVSRRGAQVGKNFKEGLEREASAAFQQPLLRVLGRLDVAGQQATSRLGVAFQKLSGDVDPLAAKLIATGLALNDSLARAAEKSGPALDGVGDSVTLLGGAASYFIDTVADGGPAAAANLRLIAGATADVAKYSALVLNVANKLSTNAWITGPLLPLLRKHYADAADAANRAGDEQGKLPPKLDLTTRAALGQRDALLGLSNELRAQTNPAFALLDAEDRLTAAQNKASEAVRKHGRNSVEARDATRALALAAIDLQGKAGSLGNAFAGGLTPAMVSTFRAAKLTDQQIQGVEKQLVAAKSAADKFDGNYQANVGIKSDGTVLAKLINLAAFQGALKAGSPVAAIRKQLSRDNADFLKFDTGGWTGPGSKLQEAGVVHADEFVIRKESRQRIEREHPGLLDTMNTTGGLRGYAAGGLVQWPYPVNVADTRIPSRGDVAAKVVMPFPTSGRTGPWIEAMAKMLVPGIRVISGYRPGARTLSGRQSLHALDRARDFEPSKKLAQLWSERYGSETTEEITPYQQYNRLHGAQHAYTGAIWNQHNFAGGNAHDHIAMAGGGVIGEPVYGVGRSGRSYSFGERGPETVTPGLGGGGATELLKQLVEVAQQLVAVTGGVGGDVATALNSATRRTLQTSRSRGVPTIAGAP